MRNVDEIAKKAANDEALLSDFVESQRSFILNCAYRATKKYITNNDDEWSIALIAFYDAVKIYDISKGSFLPYAETVIKRRLIDYFRSNLKYNQEISVSPRVFDTEPNEENEEQIKIAVAEKLIQNKDDSIKFEIEVANTKFEKFGFSFYDLIECSPKSFKTKEACKKVILYILENEEVIKNLYEKNQLPIKTIQKNTETPRKLIEHHRKYIIAAVEILSGEYPCLAEYISFIRKDGSKGESGYSRAS